MAYPLIAMYSSLVGALGVYLAASILGEGREFWLSLSHAKATDLFFAASFCLLNMLNLINLIVVKLKMA